MRDYLPPIDETHDPSIASWVESANGHTDFPLQNLPFGRFRTASGGIRFGAAIGNQIVDFAALASRDLLRGQALEALIKATSERGDALLSLDRAQRTALRRALFDLLSTNGAKSEGARRYRASILHSATDCTHLLPSEVAGFSDFNAGIHHAANGGRRRGLSDPLLANYRYVPVAYNSRASTVIVSGEEVFRPEGQFLRHGESTPVFRPTEKLDFELELGFWIGRGNRRGQRLTVEQATDAISGYCLVNDWSARDIQSWESQRLGPFLGKSFATTISPWIVSPEALAPFRGRAFDRGAEYPQPLPHLTDSTDAVEGMPQIAFQIDIRPGVGSSRRRVSNTHSRHLYWTPAQMVAHHTSNGCTISTGDLMASGTVTGDQKGSFGTLLDAIDEQNPFLDIGGIHRQFLMDGDEVVFRGYASRPGFISIGFGECRGVVIPTPAHQE